MSSKQREAKVYGAVESQYNIEFTGFCKKIYSNTTQEVLVFIDNQHTDTIIANKTIQSIEEQYDMYDNTNNCFSYRVPQELMNNTHTISFTSKDGKHLLHSPFTTPKKGSPEYYEASVYSSLFNYSKKEIQNLYKKSTFGIFALDDVLQDTKFIRYLKQVDQHFSGISFSIFYFSETEKAKFYNLVKNFKNHVEFIRPSNITTILSNIEVFPITRNLGQSNKLLHELFLLISYHSHEIVRLFIIEKRMKKTINDFVLAENDVLKNYPEEFNLPEVIVNKLNNRTLIEQYLCKQEDISLDVSNESNAYQWFYFDYVKHIMDTPKYKHISLQLNLKMYDVINKYQK